MFLKDPSLIYYCVPREFEATSSFKFHANYLSSFRLLVSTLAVSRHAYSAGAKPSAAARPLDQTRVMRSRGECHLYKFPPVHDRFFLQLANPHVMQVSWVLDG